jgi:alkaline phosphatase
VRTERILACAAALALVAAGAPALGEDAGPAEAWLRQGREAVARARARVGPQPRAKSAILFVGDGMGIATVTAARILEGQRRGGTGEEHALAFEALPFTALARTYNTDFQVPDSAGTMTAMVTGAKTRAGVLSLDERAVRGDFAAAASTRLRTLFEEAEDRGRWTGVVTTTTVTHATPAACYAHTPERSWESDAALPAAAREAGFPDIARQLVEFPHGDGLEVVLGGGRAHFLPKNAADPERPDVPGARGDGRDLVEAWRKRFPGGAYVWSRAQLEAVDAASVRYLLGLFEPSHMRFEADRAQDAAGEPSLAEMTARALDVLERAPEGYVLMVEGGRIDHGHHAGNAYRALGDTLAFSDAVRVALRRTDPAETLIVVTADHGHTLSIAGYPRRGNPILGLVVGASGEVLGGSEPVKDLSGRPYATLAYANGPGYPGASDLQAEGPKRFPHLPKAARGVTRGRPDLGALDPGDPAHLQEAAVPLASETHGGEDVPIYASGPGAALFHGSQEQTYVFHALVEALGWSAAP